MSLRQGERRNHAILLRVLGEVAIRRDPASPDAAAESYRQAMALAQGLGMRPPRRPLPPRLLIGEVAARNGVSRKALRLCETAGTLPPLRRPTCGYRLYGRARLVRVVVRGHEVHIGETGNLAVLRKEEWNVLVELIQSGQRSRL